MRIAVVSDIHGNLPALEAVLADLDRQSADDVWCGGDIGWGGPWASECIAHVRQAGWTTVKGNTDVWITGDPQTVDSDEDRERLNALAEAHNVSEDDAQWLLNLPLGHSGPGSILLVHGTPRSPFVAPMPDAPASEYACYEGQASLVIFGHLHRAFLRRLQGGTLVCNTGSVGVPQDGDTACYLLIDHQGSDVTLTHRRLDYHREGAIDKARAMGGPIAQHFLTFLGAA